MHPVEMAEMCNRLTQAINLSHKKAATDGRRMNDGSLKNKRINMRRERKREESEWRETSK